MGGGDERFLKTSLLPHVFPKCLCWYRAFVRVSIKSLKLRGRLHLKGRRQCFEMKRLPTSGHVSQAWLQQPPPKRQFPSLVITACEAWNSKASPQTGASRSHTPRLSRWPPPSDSPSLVNKQLLILSLMTSHVPQITVTPSAVTRSTNSSFRVPKNLWKWNNTRFSHWHHPASSDRSEMPVHVKFGV